MKEILKKIEREYGMESGELDRFNTEHDRTGMTKLEMDSAIGHFGLVHMLNLVADDAKDPLETELFKIFVNEVTSRLSEEDMEELTNIVAQNLAESTNLEQEFPYMVSIFDEQNNPIDNLDWFALEVDAIDHAKNNPGSAVFYELYNKEKEICEYTLLWHPNAEVVDYVYDSFMYEEEDIKDDQQRVEWKLTIDGYEDLNQHDKDHARGVIAEAIETFNEFDGVFSITKDEE